MPIRSTRLPSATLSGFLCVYEGGNYEFAQSRWRAVTRAHVVALVRAGATSECGVLDEQDKGTAA